MLNQRILDVGGAIAHREVKSIIFSCTSCESVIIFLLIAATTYLKPISGLGYRSFRSFPVGR
jgi:hypothetical protein